MIYAGVKELKNNLSRYLSRVKEGNEVLITERGKVIARIVRERQDGKSLQEALAPLISGGMIGLPRRQLNRRIRKPVEIPGKPLGQLIAEERR